MLKIIIIAVFLLAFFIAIISAALASNPGKTNNTNQTLVGKKSSANQTATTPGSTTIVTRNTTLITTTARPAQNPQKVIGNCTASEGSRNCTNNVTCHCASTNKTITQNCINGSLVLFNSKDKHLICPLENKTSTPRSRATTTARPKIKVGPQKSSEGSSTTALLVFLVAENAMILGIWWRKGFLPWISQRGRATERLSLLSAEAEL
ncbi:uncharacterized protein LOC132193823 [Neocloeon triangulifer]|uniref:uncharacterized protein LOC132193823 n=1 Tax=Neocloeon triangulifer TaxID=2078957 RepID=UPI00286FA917|nr:uncharacterized protein LOC132193823 [Neocloeon triangulifer]